MRGAIKIPALVTVLAMAMLLCACGDADKFSWNESYLRESEQPYGTSVLYKLLENYNKDGELKEIDQPVVRVLQPSYIAQGNYVFIGHSLFLGEQASDSLREFVRRGSNALLLIKSVPAELLSDLGCAYDTSQALMTTVQDSMQQVNLYHPSYASPKPFKIKFVQRNKPKPYQWSYIKTGEMCDADTAATYLGHGSDDYVNFVKIPYGKGNFYIHSTPLAFTNYHLVTEEGYQYASKVFSHLGPGDIYWDEFSRIGQPSTDPSQGERSPLAYIFSQRSLKWALYITLALLLIFILFRSKRKQRVVPILESKENTSLEFVQTIGTLYFQQNEHRQLALQKMKLFLQFIRNRYNVPTNNVSREIINKISFKSQVPASSIESIFDQHQWIESQPEIRDVNLISFHQSIDNFYKTCI